ncbi:MAG: PHP-associated domain-containing protein, partial [Longimicrobiales bacterium]
MHVHTNLSFDCLSDPFDVLEMALDRGLDMLCITDHNEIDAALMLHERYPDRIIVGEEVKTAERVDVTGLFLRERIPAGTPARETCDRIHDQGGIVYVPHPFAPGKGGGGRILERIEAQVDVVEGFNARLHEQKLNERAVRWALNAEKPVGAGSDAHTLREIGRGRALVARFDGPASFVESMRRSRIDGVTSSRLVHLASTWAKVRK